MTTMAETTEDGSWLKKRSSVFSNSNNNSSNTTKVVDKELARLKNRGAVSAVWSNKFVQEDNNSTGGNRRSFTLSPKEPRSPSTEKFNTSRTRGSTSSISSVLDTHEQQLGNLAKASTSSLELSDTPFEETKPNRSSFSSIKVKEENSTTHARSSISSIKSKDEPLLARSSMSSIKSKEEEAVNTQSSVSSVKSKQEDKECVVSGSFLSSSKSTKSTDEHEMEAASLWFQAETLKTQLAQSNARLTRANEDIEFYKRQLEVSGQSVATVTEEKEKELRQLAELILKQDQLLIEYDLHLQELKQQSDNTSESKTQEDMIALRQELELLYKQKDQMEGTIVSLRAELEMSYSQMRLMMVVSTEIQNEFQSYKEKMNGEISDILNQKQIELQALEEKLNASNQKEITTAAAAATTTTGVAAAAAVATITHEDHTAQIKKAVAEATAHHEQELEQLRQQIITLTELLHTKEQSGHQEAELREHIETLTEQLHVKEKASEDHDTALEALREQIIALTTMLHKKDKAVQDLENQLKTQKRTMDAQVMELTQTVLEKDSLLMEYMNNSSQQEKRISASDNFFHTTQQQQQDVHEARLQMAQVRQYMYSSSDDDDEDDEVEVLHMSYSSDEDDDHIIHRHSFHSQHMVTTDNTTSHRAPHSPADTISSHVSYSSEDEEQQEKRAEIKHFSYSSVQSPSRPISLVSGEQLSAEEGNRRISQRLSGDGSIPARFSLVKETNSASWPMPPPTPPPSEPLPPVPVMEKSMEENSAVSNSTIPPPRRARSKTMARSEAPQVSAYTTSIHQTNDLPRIMPEAQPEKQEEESAPIPPPRKDHLPSLLQEQQEEPHTKWMDDPESEEDDLWCDPKPHQEWGTATAM